MAAGITETDLVITDSTDIEFLPGASNILLVAPHGHDKNDINTGKLTRLIAEQNGCSAIINETYRKPASGKSANKADKRVDLNSIPQVKTHLGKELLTPLLEYKNKIVKRYGSILILWIHGAKDENIEYDISKDSGINSSKVQVLLGAGQKTRSDRSTAHKKTVSELLNALEKNGLEAVSANPDPKKKTSFCGWDRNNMNQLFRVGQYKDTHVQSVQLEFKWSGCRDNQGLASTAKIVSGAISFFPNFVTGATLVEGEKNKLTTEPAGKTEDPVIEGA